MQGSIRAEANTGAAILQFHWRISRARAILGKPTQIVRIKRECNTAFRLFCNRISWSDRALHRPTPYDDAIRIAIP